ncbi:unnamed protein product [Moneuplotes crassus]|uniref:Uncharacterized protein n=1 Tax=Euplotes crassus TaxID=5936 RepID=A0AAD1XEW1_EUPCR|nr:unnamed protein product [Moneuplotes crassus]
MSSTSSKFMKSRNSTKHKGTKGLHATKSCAGIQVSVNDWYGGTPAASVKNIEGPSATNKSSSTLPPSKKFMKIRKWQKNKPEIKRTFQRPDPTSHGYFNVPNCKNFFESLSPYSPSPKPLEDNYISLKDYAFSPSPSSMSNKIPFLVSKQKENLRKNIENYVGKFEKYKKRFCPVLNLEKKAYLKGFKTELASRKSPYCRRESPNKPIFDKKDFQRTIEFKKSDLAKLKKTSSFKSLKVMKVEYQKRHHFVSSVPFRKNPSPCKRESKRANIYVEINANPELFNLSKDNESRVVTPNQKTDTKIKDSTAPIIKDPMKLRDRSRIRKIIMSKFVNKK